MQWEKLGLYMAPTQSLYAHSLRHSWLPLYFFFRVEIPAQSWDFLLACPALFQNTLFISGYDTFQPCWGLWGTLQGLGDPGRAQAAMWARAQPYVSMARATREPQQDLDTILRTPLLQGAEDRGLSNMAWVRNTEHLTKVIVNWISFSMVGWIKSRWRVCQMMRSFTCVSPLMLRSFNYQKEATAVLMCINSLLVSSRTQTALWKILGNKRCIKGK